MFNIRLEDAETGEVDLTLRDAEITRTYRLNDLCFWVCYRRAGGTNEGQFAVKKSQRLVVFEDQKTEWKPGAE